MCIDYIEYFYACCACNELNTNYLAEYSIISPHLREKTETHSCNSKNGPKRNAQHTNRALESNNKEKLLQTEHLLLDEIEFLFGMLDIIPRINKINNT